MHGSFSEGLEGLHLRARQILRGSTSEGEAMKARALIVPKTVAQTCVDLHTFGKMEEKKLVLDGIQPLHGGQKIPQGLGV